MKQARRSEHAPSSRVVLTGVEHEYAVRRGNETVDFRKLIHGLPVRGRRIDPGDRHAYRTPSGLKITCDAAEAEIATPPVAVGPGVFNRLVGWTEHGFTALASLAHGALTMEGVSTHISVSMDNDVVARASGMFTRTFAPALMLLMDRVDSPGLLVRPRHGRLELGGEFVVGHNLAAAVALATGGAMVCERAAGSFLDKSLLPPPVKVDVVPSGDRYGWYVARDAFGVDVYAGGRSTRLRRELAGSTSAQRVLERAWKSARRELSDLVDPTDLRPADDAVSGALLLPTERPVATSPFVHQEDSGTPALPIEQAAVGAAMSVVETPRFTLTAVAATWDFVVFAAGTVPEVFVSVPAGRLSAFLIDAAEGAHDTWVVEFSDHASDHPTLERYDQATELALWRTLELGPGLAPPERGADGVERPHDSMSVDNY